MIGKPEKGARTYVVKIQQTIIYETVATVQADSPVEAMDKAEDKLEKNLLPPMKQVHYGDAHVVSVSEKKDPA